MELAIFLQSAADVLSIASARSITVGGLLLLAIVYLIWDKYRTEKKHEKEKDLLNERITQGQKRLDDEYEKNNEEIKSIIEKYHSVATKVLETLK